jgi:hypothetical protein
LVNFLLTFLADPKHFQTTIHVRGGCIAIFRDSAFSDVVTAIGERPVGFGVGQFPHGLALMQQAREPKAQGDTSQHNRPAVLFGCA